jgi:hypothetical protein
MATVIPGVDTVHERSAWEPAGFRMALDFTSKPPVAPIWNWDRAALHYTADDDLPDGDFGEFINQIPAYLAAITISYYVSRTDGGYTRKSDGRYFPGFPIGYGFAVDWLGGVWILRGFDFVHAATGSHNHHVPAILLLTDLADPGSDEMWASVRAIQRECNRRGAKLADRPWGHGEFRRFTGKGTPTSCPGGPIIVQRDQGLGDISYDPTPPPPPPTTRKATRMNVIDHDRANNWARLVITTFVTWVVGEASHYLNRLVDAGFASVQDTKSDTELVDIMRSFGTSGPNPWDQGNAGAAKPNEVLRAAWEANRRG